MAIQSMAPGAPAATAFNLSIAMSDATLEGIDKLGSELYLFKASASSMLGGAPTVWSSTTAFSNDTEISWTETFAAYAAIGQVRSGVTFNGSSAKNIDLGSTLLVGANATTKVADGGQPGWIEITNTTTTQYACGLAQPNVTNGKVSPICAFPLYGKHSDLIQPIQKVALVFASAGYAQGTVIEGSIGPAVLVDLTKTQHVALSYDINNGWSWDSTAPVTDIPDNQFVQVLVTQPDDQQFPGGSGGGDGVTIDVLQPTVFQMSPGAHWLPITEIMHGLRGSTDGNTLAFKASHGGGVVQGTQYIVSYYTSNGGFPVPRAFRAVCTYVPTYADNPYDFKLLEDVTPYVFG